jgi:hypothetical protein
MHRLQRARRTRQSVEALDQAGLDWIARHLGSSDLEGRRLAGRQPAVPVSSGERALMNPITGIADCCARTENGQAAVAPPSNLMNSRRLIASPRGQTEYRNGSNEAR